MVVVAKNATAESTSKSTSESATKKVADFFILFSKNA
jgi:hypothetical protein